MPHGASDAARSQVTFETSRDARGMVLGARMSGSAARLPRGVLVRVHWVEAAPTGVTLGATALPRLDDAAWRGGTAPGWWYDADDRAAGVRGVTLPALPLAMAYDPTLTDLRPAVRVSVEVTVSDGTPRDPAVYIATGANGWAHSPLVWDPTTGRARGVITVPRGEWFFTNSVAETGRPSIATPIVRRRTIATDSGLRVSGRNDRVWTWRDRCP